MKTIMELKEIPNDLVISILEFNAFPLATGPWKQKETKELQLHALMTKDKSPQF